MKGPYKSKIKWIFCIAFTENDGNQDEEKCNTSQKDAKVKLTETTGNRFWFETCERIFVK